MEKITSTRVIVVEGLDDKRFIEALLTFLGIQGVQVVFVDGKSNFRTQIQALKNIPGFNLLTMCAFIRDSDSNPPISAFNSIRDSLTSAGITPPSEIQTFTTDSPRIGYLWQPEFRTPH